MGDEALPLDRQPLEKEHVLVKQINNSTFIISSGNKNAPWQGGNTVKNLKQRTSHKVKIVFR